MKKPSIYSLSIMLLGALSGLHGEESSTETKPLELALPPAVFTGTPAPMQKLPHLEKPRKGPRPALQVPVGTRLLSRGKPVTSSDAWPIIGELDYATDGDKQGEAGYYVELGPDNQWLQVDLEDKYAIHAIVLWHFHSDPRVYHDVVVQLSNDPDFKENVVTVFNNDHDGSSPTGNGPDQAWVETNEGKLIALSGQKARYVRFSSNGNTANPMNHYTEVEIWGE